ncbi:MAG: hypothetical protein IKS30_06710 [Treponema sp.]|nr:hypothetical protein [Treponema sp.]MBR4449878.1 hypothetical protein [Treponema sp.]
MKKLVTFLASCLMLGTFAFAEGYICANDLEAGEITEETKEEDGFVLNANAEKNITIENKPVHKSPDGEDYTVAIKLNGSGKPDYRSISFPAKKGETIIVHGNSGSKTDTRPLVVIGPDGKTVKELPMGPDGQAGTVATEGKVKAPADGTYTVFSKKSGINIYKITVSK